MTLHEYNFFMIDLVGAIVFTLIPLATCLGVGIVIFYSLKIAYDKLPFRIIITKKK